MTAPATRVPDRPQLALVTGLPRPRRGLGWWWFKVREAADGIRWRVLATVVPRVATTRMRQRAWLAGLERALGHPAAHHILEHLEDEYIAGNEYGWDLRTAHADPLPGPCRPVLLTALADQFPAPAGPATRTR